MFIYTKKEVISGAEVVAFNIGIQETQVEDTVDIKAYRIGEDVTVKVGEQVYTGEVTLTDWDDTNGNGVIMYEAPVKISDVIYDGLHVLFRDQNMIEAGEEGHIVLWKDSDSVNLRVGDTVIEGAIS